METELTIAIDRYDRHFPFFDGTLDIPENFKLIVKQVGETSAQRDGAHRHKRMLQDGAFDACARRDSAEDFSRLKALHCTAMGLIFIPAYRGGSLKFADRKSGQK